MGNTKPIVTRSLLWLDCGDVKTTKGNYAGGDFLVFVVVYVKGIVTENVVSGSHGVGFCTNF